ncbi:unnamed protein product, partial [Phaeothamnion confervicola]
DGGDRAQVLGDPARRGRCHSARELGAALPGWSVDGVLRLLLFLSLRYSALQAKEIRAPLLAIPVLFASAFAPRILPGLQIKGFPTIYVFKNGPYAPPEPYN